MLEPELRNTSLFFFLLKKNIYGQLTVTKNSYKFRKQTAARIHQNIVSHSHKHTNTCVTIEQRSKKREFSGKGNKTTRTHTHTLMLFIYLHTYVYM